MRLHIVGFPHTQTTTEYLSCAYTQKVVKFCQMMYGKGHELFLYGGEHNEAPCDEFITLIKDEDQAEWFGPHDPNALPSIQFHRTEPYWTALNDRAAVAIKERQAAKDDLVLVLGGHAQAPLKESLAPTMIVEYGIGYSGVFSDYCCFESNVWRHYVYGLHRQQIGNFYDTVIPNYFEPSDFVTDAPHPFDGEPYLLFIGRLVVLKGPAIAALIADELNMPLVVCGQGGKWEDGKIVAPEVTVEGKDIRYIGPVDKAARAMYMKHAAVQLAPTTYVEPFGGVAVEGMLAGTPVVTTDYGAFVETVPDALRFNTLREGSVAVKNALEVDGEALRQDAISKYSLDAIAPKYDAWFNRLQGLWHGGWYTQ